MKKLLLLLFICFFSVLTPALSQGNPTPPPHADGVSFSYDNAGNRKARDWVCLSCAVKLLSEKEKDSVVAELDEDFQEKINNTKLAAYPNPVTEYLNVVWNSNQDKTPTELQLYTLDAKIIYRKKILRHSGQLEIPVNKYPSGMYILVVAYKDGENESFKIIKN